MAFIHQLDAVHALTDAVLVGDRGVQVSALAARLPALPVNELEPGEKFGPDASCTINDGNTILLLVYRILLFH